MELLRRPNYRDHYDVMATASGDHVLKDNRVEAENYSVDPVRLMGVSKFWTAGENPGR
jgi:hypothetical protein